MHFATVYYENYVAVTEGQTTSGQTADLKFAACLASGADLSKFEQFKADSCYLLDPLAAELENSLSLIHI